MKELLYICRDWADTGTEHTVTFTVEELTALKDKLGLDSEVFSEFITGLSCDSYADESCYIMKDMYAETAQYDEPEHRLNNVYERCMKDIRFQTCYTTYRLWNLNHTPEEALHYWKDSCLCTLEGLVEQLEE